jgi:GNAT superfamily N-acetyltransferase
VKVELEALKERLRLAKASRVVGVLSAPPPKPVPAIHASAVAGEVPLGLLAIEQNESSGGVYLDHALVKSGMNAGTRAGGPFGMMPLTFKGVVENDGDLQTRYGDVASKTPDDITLALNENLSMAKEVAVTHYRSLMKSLHSNHVKVAYAWLHGLGGALAANEEKIAEDEYVRRYMMNYTHLSKSLKTPKHVAENISAPMFEATPMVVTGSGDLSITGGLEKAKVDYHDREHPGKGLRHENIIGAADVRTDRMRRAADAFHPHSDPLDNTPGHEGVLTEHSIDRLNGIRSVPKANLPKGRDRSDPKYSGTNNAEDIDRVKKTLGLLERLRDSISKAKVDEVMARRLRDSNAKLSPQMKRVIDSTNRSTIDERVADMKADERASRHFRTADRGDSEVTGHTALSPTGGFHDALLTSRKRRSVAETSPKLPKGHDRSHPKAVGTNNAENIDLGKAKKFDAWVLEGTSLKPGQDDIKQRVRSLRHARVLTRDAQGQPKRVGYTDSLPHTFQHADPLRYTTRERQANGRRIVGPKDSKINRDAGGELPGGHDRAHPKATGTNSAPDIDNGIKKARIDKQITSQNSPNPAYEKQVNRSRRNNRVTLGDHTRGRPIQPGGIHTEGMRQLEGNNPETRKLTGRMIVNEIRRMGPKPGDLPKGHDRSNPKATGTNAAEDIDSGLKKTGPTKERNKNAKNQLHVQGARTLGSSRSRGWDENLAFARRVNRINEADPRGIRAPKLPGGRTIADVGHDNGNGVSAKDLVEKSNQLVIMKMAIADIKAGGKLGESKDHVHYNYNHVLSDEHRKAGYTLHVLQSKDYKGKPTAMGAGMKPHVKAVINHNRQPVGEIEGYHEKQDKDEGLTPHSQIDAAHRGKGLGVKAYEALYAHAKHKMGLHQVLGWEHSDDASRVHRSLARKHGLDYHSKPGQFGDNGSYQYALKSEEPSIEKSKGGPSKMKPSSTGKHGDDVAVEETRGYEKKFNHAPPRPEADIKRESRLHRQGARRFGDLSGRQPGLHVDESLRPGEAARHIARPHLTSQLNGPNPARDGKLPKGKTIADVGHDNGNGVSAKDLVEKAKRLEIMKMAIEDLKPGPRVKEREKDRGEGNTPARVHDYSHILPPDARKQGYSMEVTHFHDPNFGHKGRSDVYATVRHSGKNVGELRSRHDELGKGPKDLRVQDAVIYDKAHRGKGLGSAMYEATYTHAKHKMGLTHVAGDTHSTLASGVHQRLAAKHGLDYKPEKNAGPKKSKPGDYDNRMAPYRYKLEDKNRR